MKSMTKKLIVLLVVALLLATMFTLVACDPKDDDKDSLSSFEQDGVAGQFIVQVLLPDGKPALGCRVIICEIKSDGQTGLCHYPKEVDENGIATLTKDELEYTGCGACHFECIENSLPKGYEFPFDTYPDEDNIVHLGKKAVLKLRAIQA